MKRRSVSRGIEASQINKSVTPPIRNLMNTRDCRGGRSYANLVGIKKKKQYQKYSDPKSLKIVKKSLEKITHNDWGIEAYQINKSVTPPIWNLMNTRDCRGGRNYANLVGVKKKTRSKIFQSTIFANSQKIA